MTSPIETLVVDDDPLSRERIRTLLEARSDFLLVGECSDGREGVESIRAQEPQLVFLDVQMPVLDGFGVVQEIGAERMPVVIFTSAYVDHALRAFEAYALDYLLKPFDEQRFDTALRRARERVAARAEPDARIDALLQFLQRPADNFPEVLAIKTGNQFQMVRMEEIDWIEADGNYARLHVGATERLLSKTLTELESRVLDPASFVRIHRSTIVNLEWIAALEPLFHGDLAVILREGQRLVCSRRHRHRLQEHVYFTS